MRLSVQSRVCLGHAASMKHDVLEVVTVLACIVGVFFVETHVGSVSVALDTFEKVSFQGVEIEDLLAGRPRWGGSRGDGEEPSGPAQEQQLHLRRRAFCRNSSDSIESAGAKVPQ